MRPDAKEFHNKLILKFCHDILRPIVARGDYGEFMVFVSSTLMAYTSVLIEHNKFSPQMATEIMDYAMQSVEERIAAQENAKAKRK